MEKPISQLHTSKLSRHQNAIITAYVICMFCSIIPLSILMYLGSVLVLGVVSVVTKNLLLAIRIIKTFLYHDHSSPHFYANKYFIHTLVGAKCKILSLHERYVQLLVRVL